MKIESLMWLFPIFFMVHDFEEIIFLPTWLNKNMAYIRTKYPLIANKMPLNLKNGSSASFAIGVFEEFIFLSVLTFFCVEYDMYSFYSTLIIGYLFHVIIHVVQTIALRKYIPAIGTALLTSIYAIYTLRVMQSSGYLNWSFIIIILPLVITAIVLNMFFAHWLAAKCNVGSIKVM